MNHCRHLGITWLLTDLMDNHVLGMPQFPNRSSLCLAEQTSRLASRVAQAVAPIAVVGVKITQMMTIVWAVTQHLRAPHHAMVEDVNACMRMVLGASCAGMTLLNQHQVQHQRQVQHLRHHLSRLLLDVQVVRSPLAFRLVLQDRSKISQPAWVSARSVATKRQHWNHLLDLPQRWSALAVPIRFAMMLAQQTGLPTDTNSVTNCAMTDATVL